MRFFYDTEFIENGRTIDLISIGIVCEDGREYYAVSTEFDASRANSWVQRNVLGQLPPRTAPEWKSRATIRHEVSDFITRGSGTVELWAWAGAYDHVALAQLWGTMAELPKFVPHFSHELRQLWEFAGRPELPTLPHGKHNALADARHNVRRYQVCVDPLRAN